MSSTIEDVSTATLLAQLDVVVDELLTRSRVLAADDELLADWAAVERVRCRLAAFETGVVAEIDTRGLAQARNIRTTAALGRQLLRLAPGEAHARVQAAKALGPRTTLAGQRLDP